MHGFQSRETPAYTNIKLAGAVQGQHCAQPMRPQHLPPPGYGPPPQQQQQQYNQQQHLYSSHPMHMPGMRYAVCQALPLPSGLPKGMSASFGKHCMQWMNLALSGRLDLT